MIDMTKNNSNFFIQVTAIRATPRHPEREVCCFPSSEGFSQATRTCGASPRLISLPFRRHP